MDRPTVTRKLSGVFVGVIRAPLQLVCGFNGSCSKLYFIIYLEIPPVAAAFLTFELRRQILAGIF
jgi:hypothetical protein